MVAAVFNAANEIAVGEFLRERIAFGMIAKTVEYVLSATTPAAVTSLEDVFQADADARRLAVDYLGRKLCS